MHECTALFNQPDKTQIKSEPKYPLFPGFSTPTSLAALHLRCLTSPAISDEAETFSLAPQKHQMQIE